VRGWKNENHILDKENKLLQNSLFFLFGYDFIRLFHVLTYITDYAISSVPDCVTS